MSERSEGRCGTFGRMKSKPRSDDLSTSHQSDTFSCSEQSHITLPHTKTTNMLYFLKRYWPDAVSSLVSFLVFLLKSSGCGKKLFIKTAQDALWKAFELE